MGDVQRTRRRAWWIGGIVAAVLVVGGSTTAWMLRPAEPAASAPSPRPTIESPSPTPTPTPTPTGYPANTNAYDVSVLPQVNVFAVLPALPIDPAPTAAFTGEQVRSIDWAAPVFADPLGEPVAYLSRDYVYDGTTVPVVARDANWLQVLLPGRQAIPSAGNPAQIAGWVRAQDVEVTTTAALVDVSISARTVDIVQGGVTTRVATDFGWGTDATPTPLGRTFIMTTRVEPDYTYTRGHAIVYFGVQSPTLDGFGGADVAITAFHYHDERSGPISNGCLRLDGGAIDALALLPAGTPVNIRP